MSTTYYATDIQISKHSTTEIVAVHCGLDPGEIFFNILRLWSQMVV